MAVMLVLPASPLTGQTRDYDPKRPFGTLREQAKVQQTWLQDRLENNLPLLMRKHGVDMWVVAMRAAVDVSPCTPSTRSGAVPAARW